MCACPLFPPQGKNGDGSSDPTRSQRARAVPIFSAHGKIQNAGGRQFFAFGGWGMETPAASASAGAIGFASGAGVYAEGFLLGKGGGVGAYLNVTTNAGCAGSQVK